MCRAARQSLTLGYSGGIRGIVELEVLRRIEKALGDLPIQCFFDLIVGTRYLVLVEFSFPWLYLTIHAVPVDWSHWASQP